MACRTYDRTLECGCMYSSDGGGGLMPCGYGKEQPNKCEKAHKKWYKSEDYKKYCEEVKEKNS